MTDLSNALQAGVQIGSRHLASRFFLAPLAGYTHLAFRVMLRRLGGLGMATTDLVQSQMLISETRKSLELVTTCPEDRPLSVQIYSGVTDQLVSAAKWLEDHDYQGIDINMGCPMAKVTGAGGGARLMCDTSGASEMVGRVIDAVRVPVTVKMRLGWDDDNLTAPELAAAFEQIGVAAVTVHGRTRQQGFHGRVNRPGIRETVRAVRSMPIHRQRGHPHTSGGAVDAGRNRLRGRGHWSRSHAGPRGFFASCRTSNPAGSRVNRRRMSTSLFCRTTFI